MDASLENSLSRRGVLKSLLAAGLAGVFPHRFYGQGNASDGVVSVLDYLETLRKGEGGYAWHGQNVPHLTPTLYAIGCYQALGKVPPRKEELVKFTGSHHPQKIWPLSERRFIFNYQHLQALAWLGEDIRSMQDEFSSLKAPRGYNKRYEKQGHPYFQAEVKHFQSCKLLGLPNPGTPFVDYLDTRRRENGSYNTTLASEGGDGNILNTWWGLEALNLLGRIKEKKESTIRWLQKCQLRNGGFTHQPEPEIGGWDDVAYTWAAVRALHLLGSEPKRKERCIQYLESLANADGGFSDKPGWLSNPMATFYAVDALTTLSYAEFQSLKRRPIPRRKALPRELKVYSIQIESHGQGSPTETVALAKALKIHLWGAKNAKPGWREAVEKRAKSDNVPVSFFLADEEYGSWIDLPGTGTYSHIADIMAPSDAAIGESVVKESPVSWSRFRNQRLAQLREGEGRLNWQFGQHEDAIRLFLDDSLMRPGYSAISTFHFGNIDFTTSEPFLHRWRGQLPFIALQDAHGKEPWWFSDQTEGMRTLFLGDAPTWEAWLKALDNNWVAAVRHDYRTNFETWIHSGSDEVTQFVKERERDWRWWENPDIGRPMLSMVAVKPEDTFEVARPETGINLRIRVAHRNTNHGILKEPLAEFESLTLNGETVSPNLVSVPSTRSPEALEDQYYLYSVPALRGPCQATATVRELSSGKRMVQTLEFTS